MKQLKIMVVWMMFLSLFAVNIQAKEVFEIRFYNEDEQLIKVEQVESGQLIAIPVVKKEGYNFKGYNTKQDGSGEFLRDHRATKSMDYYSIFAAIDYQVSYYVDSELLEQRMVAYGSVPPNIAFPARDKYTFEYWNDLSNVTGPRNILAVYAQDESKKERMMSLVLINKVEASELVETPTMESATPIIEYSIVQGMREHASDLGIIFVITLVVSMAILVLIQYKRKH